MFLEIFNPFFYLFTSYSQWVYQPHASDIAYAADNRQPIGDTVACANT